MEIAINTSLKLIGAHPRHAEEFFRRIETHRRDLQKWLPWVPAMRTVEDERNFLRDAARFNTGGQSLTMLIFYQGQIAGSLAFVKIDRQNLHAELGYMLFPDFRGKGLMTMACRALISHAFRQMKLERVYALIEPENEPSLALVRRLGFQREGLLRKHYKRNNALRDLVYMALLKSEFKP